jgi:hypothetical protein
MYFCCVMNGIAENYLFCSNFIDPKTVDPEHIIPGSIDGSVVTYNVCGKCNNTLGTEVDAELNRHRHIWDGRKRHNTLPIPKTPFRMQRKFAIGLDETEIPMVSRSDSNRILTHKLSFGGIRTDRRIRLGKDPYFQWLDKERKKIGMDDESFHKHHVQRYIEAREKGSYLGKHLYRDWLFTGIDVFFGEEQAVRAASIMSSGIPHRFVAKACVEYAYLFDWQDEIANLDDLKSMLYLAVWKERRWSLVIIQTRAKIFFHVI